MLNYTIYPNTSYRTFSKLLLLKFKENDIGLNNN